MVWLRDALYALDEGAKRRAEAKKAARLLYEGTRLLDELHAKVEAAREVLRRIEIEATNDGVCKPNFPITLLEEIRALIARVT